MLFYSERTFMAIHKGGGVLLFITMFVRFFPVNESISDIYFNLLLS